MYASCLIRPAAVGERLAIYASEPHRWVSLSQPNIAMVEPGTPLKFVTAIIVNDGSWNAPSAGLALTVITLGRLDRGPAPDMSFVQNSRETVRITAGGSTKPSTSPLWRSGRSRLDRVRRWGCLDPQLMMVQMGRISIRPKAIRTRGVAALGARSFCCAGLTPIG